jgi:poly-gamma-glutamate synthesis protein (capsule biosynthesis protein)
METFGRLPTAVCLANNHIMDFGVEGYRDTIATLRDEGVQFFGAGDLRDGCNNPALVRVGSHTIALLGYVCPTTFPVFATEERPGVAPIDIDRIAADVGSARARGASRVVVSLHWGVEEIELPPPADVETGRRIAEIPGVDLIIGHHAHCVLPWEEFRGVPIFYGLGNAIFPDLEVPAEYDDAGTPTVVWRKRQQAWNKRSLAVTWDVETRRAAPTFLRFDRDTLCIADGDPARAMLHYPSASAYAARFKRSFMWGTIRNKAMRYISDPKFPEPRHIKSVIAIAREALWRESR